MKIKKVWKGTVFGGPVPNLRYVTAARTPKSGLTAYAAAASDSEQEHRANAFTYVERLNVRPATSVAGAKTPLGGVWLLGLRQHE
jgi:hypothetical protein